MKAKEYLGQALWLDERINKKLLQADHLRGLAQKTTTTFRQDPVSETRQRSRIENALVRLVDLEARIDQDVDRLADLRKDIVVWIHELDNLSYSQVLEYRYVYGYTWEEVSRALGFHLRWVYRLHTKALAAMDDVFENAGKTGHPKPLYTTGET